MKNNIIKSKKIVTLGLTAMMLMGSTCSFWDLSESELNDLAFNDFTVTVYGADLSQFSDTIPQWASSDVSYLVDKGIMQGYPDGTFKPSGTMTRLEFLVATVRGLKTDEEINNIINNLKTEYTEQGVTYSNYSDFCRRVNEVFQQTNTNNTAEAFWGTDYLLVADYLGLTNHLLVVTPVNGTEIGWEQPILREEAALVMYYACKDVRGEDLPETKGIHNIIPDFNSINTTCATAVRHLVSNGLIAGVDDNYTFAPEETLTRAQASCILARITDTSRRLAKPVVPEDQQEWINFEVERDVTYHNPVTGQDETMDINDWHRNVKAPSYNGTTEGEYSADGYFQWDAALQMWIRLAP